MIGLLRGTVVLRTGECEVIVDVAGVGYRVSVTPATAVALGAGGPASGAEATLYVHTHVREDAIVLYGFVHDDERRCFEVLLGSHGVGPALALAIMAMLSPAALSTAVLEDDIETLCTVPGVGRKTAARLLIELKSRLDLPDLSLDSVGAPVRGGDGVRTDDPHVAGRGARRARVSSATPPTRSAVRSTAYATMSAWKRCCGWPCGSWPAGEPPRPPRGPGRRRRRGRPRRTRRGSSTRWRRGTTRRSRKSASVRARWPSSSGSPSWSSTSASSSRRRASAANPSTTSSSRAPRVSARPRWPASLPSRWRPRCASRPDRS